REAEAVGSLGIPRGDGPGIRHPIEGVVDLHRREARRVVRQHLRGGELLGVEAAPPLGVVVAGCPDPHRHGCLTAEGARSRPAWKGGSPEPLASWHHTSRGYRKGGLVGRSRHDVPPRGADAKIWLCSRFQDERPRNMTATASIILPCRNDATALRRTL